MELQIVQTEVAGVARLELVANGTQIVIADAPGEAIRVTIVGEDASAIADLTIRRGPTGATS